MEPSRAYLAIDIGGTKLAAGVVDDSGSILLRDRVPTPTRDPWDAVARLLRRVRAAVGDLDASLVGCGVACGGPMSGDGEVVSPLHIPSWREFPLRAAVGEITSLPTFVDNDAKALLLGEMWQGSLGDATNAMAVVIGTGVGAGVLLDGHVLHGRLGNAGHLGHVIVEPDGRPCTCGGSGCLEAYISGAAVEVETGRPAQRCPLAIVERNGRLLARAVASVGALLDLTTTVVGGSVALGFGAPFFAAANDELEERARLGFIRNSTIAPVALGPKGPLIGAAALARRGLESRN